MERPQSENVSGIENMVGENRGERLASVSYRYPATVSDSSGSRFGNTGRYWILFDYSHFPLHRQEITRNFPQPSVGQSPAALLDLVSELVDQLSGFHISIRLQPLGEKFVSHVSTLDWRYVSCPSRAVVSIIG
jgi:hypothetical protein